MSQLTHSLLSQFPVVIAIDLAWGEMDAYQHVNNAVYLRYAESSRLAYFAALGFPMAGAPTGVAPILHSISCRYRIPLTYPDRILVGTRADEIGADRFTAQFRIVSLTHDAVAAEGAGIVVSFDYSTSRKAPLPDRLRRRIAELQPPPAP